MLAQKKVLKDEFEVRKFAVVGENLTCKKHLTFLIKVYNTEKMWEKDPLTSLS